MSVVALIPARGGSKGILRKNLRLAGGVPLVVHAVRQALAARSIDRVVLSTDDAEIAEVGRKAGAEVPFVRPAEFATDDATDLMVFTHFLEHEHAQGRELPELVVQVRASSPVRRPEVLDLAVARMRSQPLATSLRSVSLVVSTPYKMWQRRSDGSLAPVMSLAAPDFFDGPRQSLPDVFAQDGLVDVVRSSTVMGGSMAGDHILGLFHPDVAVDIDCDADLVIADRLLSAAPAECTSVPRVGIVQGRLVPSSDGSLQSHPRERWAEEFVRAAELGLTHVELFVDADHGDENPFLSATGRGELRRVSHETGIGCSVVCLDLAMRGPLDDGMEQQLSAMAPLCAEAGVELAVLPLMGAGAPEESADLARSLRRLANVFGASGVTLTVECLLTGPDLYELAGRVCHDNFGITYDIGNTAAAGHDSVVDIALLAPVIRHVHAKDKDASGANVPLGAGIASLPGVLAVLNRIGYQGRVSLETPRGVDPLAAAANHLAFVKNTWSARGHDR